MKTLKLASLFFVVAAALIPMGALCQSYDKYAYTQTLFHINCSRKKDRAPLYRDYDTAGKMIGTHAHVADFTPVDNSVERALINAVCK